MNLHKSSFFYPRFFMTHFCFFPPLGLRLGLGLRRSPAMRSRQPGERRAGQRARRGRTPRATPGTVGTAAATRRSLLVPLSWLVFVGWFGSSELFSYGLSFSG